MSKSAELRARKAAAVAAGVSSKGIYVAKAENSELWDVDGRRYVDFAAGIAVLNTGHRHPRVMAAVAQQAELFAHTCFHVVSYESYVRLAERLNALAPGDFAKKSLFLSSGAEALENAVKIARYHTKRSAIIAFSGGFHGRTLMTLALTGKVMPYKRGFGPYPAEVYHAEFPLPYRGITTEQALADLDRLFAGDVDPKSVAAIVVEPVQGEGGFNVAPFDFLRALRRVCDEHGIVMIADEVQGGIARTGKMFSIEHSGVVPDLLTTAKGLGGGFPLSGVTGRATIMDSAHTGGLGGTYGGNPISIAAAHAVLDVIEAEGLCARATRIGQRMRAHLEALAKEIPAIGDVRGLGAMVAFELVKDPKTKEPDAALTASILACAEKRGLILLSCGTEANVVRLLAPLTIPDAILEEGLSLLSAAVKDARGAESARAA
ncbi:MAG TPA: 4-aminobutyrate--2-oxoglutarate transaminase [Steroidobacteraceae bacterium]|nr:4-aminobutyrate--2-oxoglutarate transaminase [Steroidobacteraceae bacterium]